MIEFQDRIQKNPRLLRLKNPITGEIIDWEIQDLSADEILQEGTEINAEVLNKLFTQCDLMSVTMASIQTIAAQTVATVALDTIVCSNGSDLTLSENKIVCNRAGIIEVSGNIEWGDATASGNMATRILKNKSTISETVIRPPTNNIIANHLASVYESVSAGDTISLTACNWTDSSHTVKPEKNVTRLNVRYID